MRVFPLFGGVERRTVLNWVALVFELGCFSIWIWGSVSYVWLFMDGVGNACLSR